MDNYSRLGGDYGSSGGGASLVSIFVRRSPAEADSERVPPKWRRSVLRSLLVVLGCLWFVGVWVSIPWFGTWVGGGTRDKIFWTALSAFLVGIIGWGYVQDERRLAKQARWRSNVESAKAEVERLEKAYPGVEILPESVKARGFVIMTGYHGLPREDLDSVLSEGAPLDRRDLEPAVAAREGS